MSQSAAGIFKIVLFLALGFLFKKKAILSKGEVEGIKKVVLRLALPSTLYLSFSQLEFRRSLLPVTAAVLSLNLLLFLLGVLFYRLGGSRHRLLPLGLSTLNFGLLGIPLFEAVHGTENLGYYTLFGIGSELYLWFLFSPLSRWFLGAKTGKGILKRDFLHSPLVWGILLGCLAGIGGLDIGRSPGIIPLAIFKVLTAASQLSSPLTLLFIGYQVTLSPRYLKSSLQYTLLRLSLAYALGYLIKGTFLVPFLPKSPLFNAGYFLLLSLPPAFSLPLLVGKYLEEEELALLSHRIIFQGTMTIGLFSLYSLLIP